MPKSLRLRSATMPAMFLSLDEELLLCGEKGLFDFLDGLLAELDFLLDGCNCPLAGW